MKVCGFTFIRNAVLYDYPVVEAIRSILPICDGFVVAVGRSDDATLELIKGIDPKIQIIETVWDKTLTAGGRVFADETDKAFQAIPDIYDWAFYIQGDEVLHEKYLPVVKQEMSNNLRDKRIDGLLFNYLHFYGSYDFVGQKHSWYRREIRVIRNRKDIFSYRDAQGFRKKPNDKLKVRHIDAFIYHYGWVREPDALQKKETAKSGFYQSYAKVKELLEKTKTFDYQSRREPLQKFSGSHPHVMDDRIARKNWPFKPDLRVGYYNWRDFLKRTIGKLTGWYPGEYKNYKIIR
ncbi:MAG: glycosyltransferase family 2 protein [Cyclobacteriaceae bacterium]|nr:glycosyltransferase family 2 protein [Cyclobacteriaceae bacterium]